MMTETYDFVDGHFHVWDLERFKYLWPTPDMERLYKNFYPCAYETAHKDTPVKHGIFVQVRNDAFDEAKWVIDMASRHPVIKGIVAGLDLTSDKLESQIQELLPSGLLKGTRHILDFEVNDWITREDVGKGLQTVAKYGLTFDLLVRPHHLPYVPQVVSKHPDLKFIIDHIAKPPVVEGKLDGWKEDMAAIAKFPNVYCKLSALISEQEPEKWKDIKFQPFVDHVINIFTPDRIVFGSDWPVFSIADASYQEVLNLLQGLVSNLSPADKRKIFRENAIKFYNVNV